MSEAKTILVTGGSGYIGGQVCRLLVDAGHNVINVDRRKSDIPGVTLYPFDIDNHQLKGVIQLTKPNTIMHFAADHEVGRSMSEPGVFYWNNVANTIALLNHAVEAGVENFIFSSSSSVYGDIDTFPTTESTPKSPVSSYGLSKSIIEDILPDYKRAYGLNYAALRYFNAAGASPDNTHGYKQEKASHIVPIISRKILAGENVEVFGNDYDTADGTCERDYTHMFDIATAHLAADNYLSDGGESDIFNIGAGNSMSVLQVINAFERVLDTTVHYEFVPRRDGDAPKTFADNTKAREAFGWEPLYGLDDIVAHGHAWEEKNFKK
jgi:UDP-glucose 4-epimerase